MKTSRISLTKRLLSGLLVLMMVWTMVPVTEVNAEWSSPETVEISNEYVRVTVSKENGGYVIATKEGDILKKSDNDKDLTHRGSNYDTSFATFRINGKDYVFGNKYTEEGMKSSEVSTVVDEGGTQVASFWDIGSYRITQMIQLVNSLGSEQLGTAQISYIVANNSGSAAQVKSRMLMDTQLGDQDYGYYELPSQKLGEGYESFEYERTWDSTTDPGVKMPSDYFVRDERYSSKIVGYGVNSVFNDKKPYKMTFAHWANIAATAFDYEPDTNLNFTNAVNDTKTADSAVALYYDLGTIPAGGNATISTYYGVNANVKNKDNKVLLNVTAPSYMELNDSKTAYIGSDGEADGIVRINATINNPSNSGKTYKKLRAVVYTVDFDSQRKDDSGKWTVYSNENPLYTEILNLKPGDSRTTYFDFKLSPEEKAQLGTFVIRVYDMDESVNELGNYAEDYTLASNENYIVMPGMDSSIPPITLNSVSPAVSYNDEIRYITVTGKGMRFLKSDLLDHIEFVNDSKKRTYKITSKNLIFPQGDDPTYVTLMLDEYMDPGSYTVHFIFNNGGGLLTKIKNGVTSLFGGTEAEVISNLPSDYTAAGMKVVMSSDKSLKNDKYGIVTVQRDGDNKYKIESYRTEGEYTASGVKEDDVLLSFKGDIEKDKSDENKYRLVGENKDVKINGILNYNGSNLTLEASDKGSVKVLMDGKITTLGANTTVRKGTAAFILNAGTNYVIPVYDEDGEVTEYDSLTGKQDYIRLKWDNAIDDLMTIGGFLINLKFGVLGKIEEKDGDKATYTDVISFGGKLDISFITPGGAEKARQNTAGGGYWTTKIDESQTVYVEPANEDADKVEIGADIKDVLFGGKEPGYIGINMEAKIGLPQIVSFLPDSLSGELSINTINGYKVGVSGEAELATFSMAFSLVVKGNDKGVPIPDSLFFSIGGFEPGVNVDGLGILWITGGGGGFSDLYDTIYGSDGLPPLTLLLNVQFDITKIMTGTADLSLSLSSISVEMSDISLKALKKNKLIDAKFMEKAMVGIGWYPNFSFEMEGSVKFASLFTGTLNISAAAGSKVDDFIQFVLTVALALPDSIPIVGGMELASAQLGGGSEKVWGSAEVLSLVKVGFTYYWGEKVEFTSSSAGGTENLATLAGEESEAQKAYNELSQGVETGVEDRYISIGGNLDYITSSKVVADPVKETPAAVLMSEDSSDSSSNITNPLTSQVSQIPEFSLMAGTPTQIYTNAEKTLHVVNFSAKKDYLLSISHTDGTDVTEDELKKALTVTCGDASYPVNYYVNPGADATDAQKTEALSKANMNISNGHGWLVIPASKMTDTKFTLNFNNNTGYDVGAIRIAPIGSLKDCSSSINGNELTVNWKGENLSDDAEILVCISDVPENTGAAVNTVTIPAAYSGANGSAKITLPENLSTGSYNVTLVYSDEEVCYDEYPAGSVELKNSAAPNSPESVNVENNGNYKLKVDVNMPENSKFDGYLVDVYQSDGTMADSGLYFKKGSEIIIGGKYNMPVYDEKGNPVMEANGKDTKTVEAGYKPGETYSVKVRAANLDKDGVYQCSKYVLSNSVKLNEATAPKSTISYDKAAKTVNIASDVPVKGDLYLNGKLVATFTDMSNTLTWNKELTDGTHTLEFHAIDGDNDKAMVTEIVEIDTTPPVLLMESPVSGGNYQGETLTISAESEPDLTFEFYIDGEKVTPNEKDVLNGSRLECTLPIGNKAGVSDAVLKITAKDKAGNITEKTLLLNNGNLADIQSISLEAGGKSKSINLSKNEKAELKVKGILSDGKAIDITGLENTTIELCGGDSVEMSDGSITAIAKGESLIKAEFDLGGESSLVSAAVVSVNETNNVSELNNELSKALLKNEADYSKISWKDLRNAINLANEVKLDNYASQEDINSALQNLKKAISELEDENPYGNLSISENGAISLNYTGKKSPKVLAAVYEGKRMKEVVALQGDMNGHYTGIINEYRPGMKVIVMFLKEDNIEPLYDKLEN